MGVQSEPITSNNLREAPLRVLVVDDTVLYRMLVSEAVRRIPWLTLIGQAENGRQALDKVRTLKPDVVLSDIEMPVMDGLQLLGHLKRDYPGVRVLVISSVCKRGSQVAIDALSQGAFDFITKPEGNDANASRAELLGQVETKLSQLRSGQLGSPSLRGSGASLNKPIGGAAMRAVSGARVGSAPTAAPASSDMAALQRDLSSRQIAAIGVGVSTGGPQALARVLPQIKRGCPPIFIVQHMPGSFLTTLATKLNTQCQLDVVEGQQGMPVRRDTIFIAPGGKQMTIVHERTSAHIALKDDPAENHCLPAVDYLFRGLADAYGRRAFGVILTGMGNDGAQGLLKMRNSGARTLVQDEASCTVFGMPKQALHVGAADYVLPLDQITSVLQAIT